jgi:hypothetical protein
MTTETRGDGRAMSSMTDIMQACISNCIACHRICIETLAHCLQMGGAHAETGHIQLLLDCAAICQLSEDFMLRTSEFHAQVCGVCAEVCERCAESCHAIRGTDTADGNADALMLSCAEVCERCAESCRQMASMMSTGRDGKMAEMAAHR